MMKVTLQLGSIYYVAMFQDETSGDSIAEELKKALNYHRSRFTKVEK